MNDLNSYLIISAILFSLGLFAIMTRRNGVAILMGIELILNAANLNFVAFNRFGGLARLDGQLFSMFVIVLAAAEAVVALAIIINLFKNYESVNVDEADTMKG
jgi:NADH-quinone oxidoreductase subunit K